MHMKTATYEQKKVGLIVCITEVSVSHPIQAAASSTHNMIVQRRRAGYTFTSSINSWL